MPLKSEAAITIVKNVCIIIVKIFKTGVSYCFEE